MTETLLVDHIHAYYGASYILHGLSLGVEAGTVVALIGRNGMGKTTTMRAVIGFNPPRRGKIYFKGEDITGLPSFKRCRRGMSLVPQGRRIFPSLSVRENIAIASRRTGEKRTEDVERVLDFFPVLRARLNNKGNQLSGGELQMLAIARALVAGADLMLMDEPSEGLAPLVIQQVGDDIQRLKGEGFSILLAEQNLPLALRVSDYVHVINKGTIVFKGTPEDLEGNREVEQEYLAV